MSLEFIAHVAIGRRPLQLRNSAESRLRRLRLCCLLHLLDDGTASLESHQRSTADMGGQDQGVYVYYANSPPRRGTDRKPSICGHGRERDCRIIPTKLVSLHRHHQRPRVESVAY